MPTKQKNWDIYFFAMKVGISSILKGNCLIGIKQLLYPVGYWRFPVFPVVSKTIGNGSKKVLDIGSPKLLSLYLALILGHDVYATDLQDQLIYDRYYKHFRDYVFKRRGGGNYIVEYQDARALHYPDNYFDYVYSISVIEHIPKDGDSQAMQEIKRVLKPMGIAIIEVPFATVEHDTFVEKSVFDRKYDNKPVFLERHYDEISISKRLIEASEMKPVDKMITAERLPFEKYWEKVPSCMKNPLIWAEAIFSSFNHYFLADGEIEKLRFSKSNEMSVILILEKL